MQEQQGNTHTYTREEEENNLITGVTLKEIICITEQVVL